MCAVVLGCNGEQKVKVLDLSMDEGRKRVILIAASILAARKLAQFDGGKRVPATISAIADAVRWAEEILKGVYDSYRTFVARIDMNFFNSPPDSP